MNSRYKGVYKGTIGKIFEAFESIRFSFQKQGDTKKLKFKKTTQNRLQVTKGKETMKKINISLFEQLN